MLASPPHSRSKLAPISWETAPPDPGEGSSLFARTHGRCWHEGGDPAGALSTVLQLTAKRCSRMPTHKHRVLLSPGICTQIHQLLSPERSTSATKHRYSPVPLLGHQQPFSCPHMADSEAQSDVPHAVPRAREIPRRGRDGQ